MIIMKLEHLLAVLSPGDNNTFRVTSGFEGGEQSLTLQLAITQRRLAVLSDHLSHQRLTHGLMGYHTT